MKYLKYTFTALVILATIPQVFSQVPVLIWQQEYSMSDKNWASDSPWALCATSDGGYIFAARIEDTIEPFEGYGESDIGVFKVNAEGVEEWSLLLGGSEHEKVLNILESPDGDYVVAGWTSSDDFNVTGNHGDVDIWVLKLSQSGGTIWKKCYGGTITEFLGGLVINPDGTMVFEAYTTSTDGDLASLPSEGNTWVVKLGPSGNILWQHRYDHNMDIIHNTFITTNDGGYAYATWRGGIAKLIKLNSFGIVEWIHEGGPYEFSFREPTMCQGVNGDFIIMGNRTIFNGQPVDPYIVYAAFDSSGNFLWQKIIDTEHSDFGYCILPLNTGGYIMSGSGTISWLREIDGAGNLVWNKDLIGLEMSPAVLMNAAGEYIVLGTFDIYSDQTEPTVVRLQKLGPASLFVTEYSDIPELCPGATFSLNFYDEIGNGPSYCEVELSDENGSFANPLVIGSGYDSPMNIVFPVSLPSSNSYLIRLTKPELGVVGETYPEAISIGGFSSDVFIETMGTVAVSATVTAHEAANGFANDNFVMSGTANINNTSSSAVDYNGASGGANVDLGSSNGTFFHISGINTLGKNSLSLSCGIYKSSLFGSSGGMTISVSTDGVNYSNLSYTLGAFSSGWDLINPSGTIPQTSNLRIKFTRTNMNVGVNFRVDDVKLYGNEENLVITPNGPVNWCGVGNVTLTAPNAVSYLWSTGATTQSILVTTAGNYTCEITSLNECIVELNEIQVTTTQQQFYSDLDSDGYGGASIISCAPNATYSILIGGDCDDENASVNPEEIEICNGLDDDCDGAVDEDMDKDADGYSACDGDCDDNNPNVHPGLVDVQNGIDDNCDGLIDNPVQNTWYQDADADGFGNVLYVSNLPTMPVGYVINALDCDDEDATRYPTAEDTCGDNIDNNCDGIVDNCPIVTCMGDLDNNGTVNVSDLLLFTSAFGNACAP